MWIQMQEKFYKHLRQEKFFKSPDIKQLYVNRFRTLYLRFSSKKILSIQSLRLAGSMTTGRSLDNFTVLSPIIDESVTGEIQPRNISPRSFVSYATEMRTSLTSCRK
jgi:hypothetical protein